MYFQYYLPQQHVSSQPGPSHISAGKPGTRVAVYSKSVWLADLKKANSSTYYMWVDPHSILVVCSDPTMSLQVDLMDSHSKYLRSLCVLVVHKSRLLWQCRDCFLLWFPVSNPESPWAHPQTHCGSAPGRDHHAQGLHIRHPGRQRHRRAELLPGSDAAAWRHHEDVARHQRRHERAGDRHFFSHHG